MSTAIITLTKEDSKSIIAKLPSNLRVEADKVFTACNDAGTSIDNAQRIVSIAFSKISADDKAIEKAGFKTFKEFACTAFGVKASQASQFKKVGDKFYNAEKPPIVTEWYSASKLYELRSVDSSILDVDAEEGILNPNMTQAQLREYADSKAIASNNPEVMKCFDAIITSIDLNGVEADIIDKEYNNITLDELKAIMYDLAICPPEDDRLAKYNPHKSYVEKRKDGKDKEISLKGLVLVTDTFFVKAVYIPTKTKKPTKAKEKSAVTFTEVSASIDLMSAEQKAKLLEMLSK